MNILSLDLEMAQPSGKIIQIGAVAGNTKSGEIIETFSRMVKIDEPLSPFIIELTGITQEINDSGISLLEAYEDLKTFRRKHRCHKQTVAWGAGDTRVLKEQVKALMPPGDDSWWDFGMRFFDTKTIFQTMMMMNERSMKAGLAKALETFKMIFIGRPHDAKDDALNTFLVFFRMAKMTKGWIELGSAIQSEHRDKTNKVEV
jgi:inhibitor of KinA sporulation pathway (predicted exonuclease)